MNFNPADLSNLAAVVLKAGAPILGGIIGGPFGAIIGNIIPQIAGAFGLAPDTPPAVIAQTVAADPAASEKLQTLEEANKTALAWAQLQVDQNNAELAQPGPDIMRFFYGGWRPAMGWLSGPVLIVYLYIIMTLWLFGLLKVPPTPEGFLGWFITFFALPIFGGLSGLRSFERYQGVALDTLPISKPRSK